MKTHTTAPNYKGFRFPPEMISHAVWLYFRFSLSFRDVEERYCQLNATLGLFSLGSGEEGSFLESFFAKNHQKTAKKSAQWGKLIKGKL